MEALKRSGFNQPLQFNNTTESEKSDREVNTKRKRRITWFNPPFNSVAKHFLALIDKNFPKTNKLSKIINRNNVKISYSCLPNVRQTISNHNKLPLEIKTTETTNENKLCNCREKETCPLKGKC